LALKGEGKMKQPPEIPGSRWTPEEDNRLRALAEDGRNAAAIAERLKRSQSAVYKRAVKLGVTLTTLSPFCNNPTKYFAREMLL
jgi:hypothetical protein